MSATKTEIRNLGNDVIDELRRVLEEVLEEGKDELPKTAKDDIGQGLIDLGRLTARAAVGEKVQHELLRCRGTFVGYETAVAVIAFIAGDSLIRDGLQVVGQYAEPAGKILRKFAAGFLGA